MSGQDQAPKKGREGASASRQLSAFQSTNPRSWVDVCKHGHMVDQLVLVNGLPGSGKTSLARPLAQALAASLVSKDAIKEAVAEVVTTASSSALGGAAMDMAWSLTASIPGAVVLESWWFKPSDLP